MLFPNAKDVGNTATRALTYVNEIEHLDERAITRVGNAAAFCRLHVDTETTGIGNCNLVLSFDNNKPSGAIVVRIDQTIRQCFLQSNTADF